jgi:hypothetical protein
MEEVMGHDASASWLLARSFRISTILMNDPDGIYRMYRSIISGDVINSFVPGGKPANFFSRTTTWAGFEQAFFSNHALGISGLRVMLVIFTNFCRLQSTLRSVLSHITLSKSSHAYTQGKKRAETRASLLATAKLLFEKLGYSSVKATRSGFAAIVVFSQTVIRSLIVKLIQ